MLSKLILLKKKKNFNFINYRLKKKVGHNNSGKITVRGKISRTKKKYKAVDFLRPLWNVVGVVLSVEYDSYRNCYTALLSYTLGYLSYIIAPEGLVPGDSVVAGDLVPLKVGNATLLRNLPLNLKIHNIEAHPFSGAKYMRSAGCYGYIIEKDFYLNFALVKFNSGLTKKFNLNCLAVIGEVSNKKFKYIKLSKAGHNILRGVRQKVRGVAMNPVDHPHGGGEGKKSPPKVSYSPWRKLGKNIKTVKKK